MSGAELYEHLRDDGAGASLGAALVVIGFVLLVSSLVCLWDRRKARRIADQHGIEIYPPDRTEQILRDALREDPDGLTRDWRWP